MRKIAVWFKDGKYVEHAAVTQDQPTMAREGHELLIVCYDEADRIEQIDFIHGLNKQTTSFYGKGKAMVWDVEGGKDLT